MSRTIDITLTVNGESVAATVPSRINLVDFLRNTLQLTGSHVGCEHGVCGACTLTVNGETVRGCLMLAVQASRPSRALPTVGAVPRCKPRLPDGTLCNAGFARRACLHRRSGILTPVARLTARQYASISLGITVAARGINPSLTQSAM